MKEKVKNLEEKKGEEKVKQKRGLTQIITTIMLVLLSLVALAVIAKVSFDYFHKNSEISSAHAQLLQENVQMKKVVVDPLDTSKISITFCCATGEILTPEEEEEQTEIKKLDIGLVIDRSGSMRQSGWTINLDSGLSSVQEALNLNVPKDGYGSSIMFNVPSGTETIAVLLTWGQVSGYPGSEGSEFALNLQNPSGTWIFGSSKPNSLSNKVDPPDNVGLNGDDYFSGISTKPQVVYIENPTSGNWNARVWGWNLRPATNRPPSQEVNISAYIGDSTQISKSDTVLSIEAAKDSARNFVNNMRITDYVSYTVFGSAGNAPLLQSLTDNKALLLTAIDNTGQQGGTAIQDGITTSMNDLNTNNRASAEKIMVILTDGQNDAGPQIVIDQAQIAKNSGIKIYTVGLTGFVDENMLKAVASDPSYYYYAADSSVLETIFDSVRERIVRESTSISLSDGFKIIFYNDTDSYSPGISDIDLGPLETKTVLFNLDGKIANITRIEIYPIKVIDGKPIIGPLLQTYTF